MAPRNTISRLTSRIDDLTERLPSRKRTMICGGSDAECREKLEEMRAAGKPIGRVLFVIIDTSGEVRPCVNAGAKMHRLAGAKIHQ